MAWAASCAVFPDEAVLPASGQAGAAGDPAIAQAGAGDVSGGGVDGEAGASGASGASGGASGSGGSAPLAGAPATGGADGCASPEQAEGDIVADSWIEQAKPATSHGNDVLLSVVAALAGENERRALLSFALPGLPAGAVVVSATLTLHLESNADVTLAERHLEMSLLGQGVDEPRASWTNWGNGVNRKWLRPGGDYGTTRATAAIPASLASGPVTFDVTDMLGDLISTELVPLPVIVVEVGPPPTPPAELAFTSREGDALGALSPQLLIDYCP